MAGDVNQRACVVEVVEQVPEADVAIVAARVGERLAMAPERVRKLIEGRTGPITRALRPDKADAIAQTFEAAGVRVIIRPAEPEELDVPSSAVATATAERAPAAVPRMAPPEPQPEVDAAVGADAVADAAFAAGAVADDVTGLERDDATRPRARARRRLRVRARLRIRARDRDRRRPESRAGYASEPEIETDYAPDPQIETDYAPDPEAVSDFAPDPETGSEDQPEPDAEGDDAPDADTGSDDVPDHEIEAEPTSFQPWARVESDPALEAGYAPDDGIVIDDDDDRRTAPRSRFTSTGEWVAGDAGVWSTSRPPRPSGEAGVWLPDADDEDDDEDDDEVDDVAIAARPDDDDEEPDAVVPDARHERGAPRREVDRRPRRPQAIAMPVSDDASGPREVPLAWRGLGPEPVGPARPLDANLPRRVDPTEPIDEDEPRRRRRGIMLILLAVAVVAFLLSQWWVASRARCRPGRRCRLPRLPRRRLRRRPPLLGGAGERRRPRGPVHARLPGRGRPGRALERSRSGGLVPAAADADHAEAAWRLGRLYEAGLGVAPDDAEARRWFRRASDLGHAEAAFAWGRSWMRELGVVWGRDGAEVWPAGVVDELATAFERAASLGLPRGRSVRGVAGDGPGGRGSPARGTMTFA
jgi:hypothetical protein